MTLSLNLNSVLPVCEESQYLYHCDRPSFINACFMSAMVTTSFSLFIDAVSMGSSLANMCASSFPLILA